MNARTRAGILAALLLAGCSRGPDPVGAVGDSFVLEAQGATVEVLQSGALLVRIGSDAYTLALGVQGVILLPVAVSRSLDGSISLETAFEGARWTRTVRADGNDIVIEDSIVATGSEDLPLVIVGDAQAPPPGPTVDMTGPTPRGDMRMPESPIVLLAGRGSAMGIALEDALSRLHHVGSRGLGVQWAVGGIALPPGDRETFVVRIMPMTAGSSYFDLVNRVRAAWGSNERVDGPFDFFDVTRQWTLLHDADALQTYFEAKGLRIVALNPWLDYDDTDYRTGRRLTREEYAATIREAADLIRAASPGIRIIGNIEPGIVQVPPATAAKLRELTLERRPQGTEPASDEDMAILRGMAMDQQDSLSTDIEGRFLLESSYPYYGGETTMFAVAAAAIGGSSQEHFVMGQIEFLLGEVGLDGVYLDGLSALWSGPLRYTHARWDGRSVELDASGAIVHRYTDLAYASISFQENVTRHILGRGATLVANSAPGTPTMQAGGFPRFTELGSPTYDPRTWNVGSQPPALPWMARGQLGTPIALGYQSREYSGDRSSNVTTDFLQREAILFLRHGLLFYPFFSDVPSGDYGALPHLFPITPTRLGNGFVVGEERIVSAVPGVFEWKGGAAVNATFYPVEGGRSSIQVTYDEEAESLTLDVSPWRGIVVVEKA